MYKKITTVILVAVMALATPKQSMASNVDDSTAAIENVAAARSVALTNRMNEIKAMDRSSLNSSEKKELRMELKSMKKEMKHSNDGVYLSVGAIIIIILLLIILL